MFSTVVQQLLSKLFLQLFFFYLYEKRGVHNSTKGVQIQRLHLKVTKISLNPWAIPLKKSLSAEFEKSVAK